MGSATSNVNKVDQRDAADTNDAVPPRPLHSIHPRRSVDA
jgi:hypothetical protein